METTLVARFRFVMAWAFSVMFFVLSASLAIVAIEAFGRGVFGHLDSTEGFLKAINMAVISLATFELGLGVNKEYASHDPESDIIMVLRRTVSRFVSIVCIALVLEALLMVIKYSQLELAGNLYYPVAIVTSAGVLLSALGLFLHFTRDCGENGARTRAEKAGVNIGRLPVGHYEAGPLEQTAAH